jgi:hypothetical protein
MMTLTDSEGRYDADAARMGRGPHPELVIAHVLWQDR